MAGCVCKIGVLKGLKVPLKRGLGLMKCRFSFDMIM